MLVATFAKCVNMRMLTNYEVIVRWFAIDFLLYGGIEKQFLLGPGFVVFDGSPIDMLKFIVVLH